jgi:lipopolysaccharide transport system permease protein
MATTASSPPDDRPLTVIRPRGRFTNILPMEELWAYRDVVKRLGRRDLTLRYRQTALGVLWVVLQPLLAAGILSFVFGSVADLPGPPGVPYYVFSFAGMVVYTLFNNTTSRSCFSIQANGHLVSKTYFPRQLLPVSTLVAILVDTAVAMGMLVVMMALTGTWSGWPLLTLPVWLLVTIVLSLGIGLFAGAFVVRYRDVGFVLPVLLQFALYASPVAYLLSEVPEGTVRTLFELNPLVGLIEGFRWATLGTAAPSWGLVVWSVVAAVLALVVGLVVFADRERKFADVI